MPIKDPIKYENTWLEDVWWEVEYFWNHSIVGRIRFVKHWFKAMFAYGRYLIKNNGDHDWDYSYLYDLLKWKLERMSKTINDTRNLQNHNRVVRQINYAVMLIDRLQGSYLSEKYGKKLEAKYGEVAYWFYAAGKPRPIKDCYAPENPKGLTVLFENAKTKEEWEAAEEYNHLLYKEERAEARKTKERLFKHIGKYIERWWD